MADGSVPLVLSPEPFSREVAYLEQPAGRTIKAALLDAVKSGAIDADDLSRTVVYVDGHRLERDHTLDRVLVEGQIINVVVEPLGGGGRKDIGQILMTIAVIAVSMWIGGGGTALGTTLLARVAAAAVLTLGQAAVAAIFAPEAENQAKVNERYALQAASNQYRPWAPMPLALGEVVVAPDFAAKTYTQSVGDDVWLHGILGLHYGPCTVADLKIGDTLASSMGVGDFRMVQHLTPGPRDFTIYQNDPDQLDLQEELEATTGSATPVVRAGSAAGERFDFDFFLPGGLHFQKDDGRVLTASVTVYIRYRPVDEDGNPTGGGGWSTAPAVSLSSTTKEPMRITRSVSLPMGRYEFEFKRSLKPDNNEKRRDRIALTAIRSVAFRKAVTDETLSIIEFAVRATALNQGTLAPITCRIIPVCETWNGTVWGSPAPTSNPAALMRWLMTGPAPALPLLPAQADTRLRAWAELCDEYDWRAGIYLLEERRQDQVIALLEQAGRASLFWDGRQLAAVCWVEKPAPVQLFANSNLRDHRWTIVYPDPVHAFRVEFQNIEEGGDPDELYVYADGYAETAGPGVEAAVLVEALRLEGQKTPERAYRDGRWELGARLHRRRIDTWTLDAEHLVSGYGARVRLAWQRVDGGTSSRIRCRRWSGGLVSGVRLAHPVEMLPGESYAVDIRLTSGVATSVPVINEADDAPVVVRELQFAVPRAPEFSPKRDDLIAFGVPTRISEDTEIIGVEPGEGLTAVLTGVRYVAPLLMAGETGPIPPLQTRLTRQRQASPPTPRLLGVQADPAGVRISFDMPPWGGSPITGFSARWRETPPDGLETPWNSLPVLDANARAVLIVATRAVPVEVGDAEGRYAIDVEIRAVTAAGQTSPEPLTLEDQEVRADPFAPTNLLVTPAVRVAPGGSSHGVLVVSVDALEAAVGVDLILEVQRTPVTGSPDPWESAGLMLAAKNPLGDIYGLRSGERYRVRAGWRTGTGWPSAWTTSDLVTVPAGSAVSDDTVNVGGVNSDLFVTRMIDVESLAATVAAGVSDLEDVYGDTVSAAASALAADADATNAALSALQATGAADEAGSAADAALVSASFASTKADEAGVSAAAASAAQVTASADADVAVDAAGDATGSATASAMEASNAAASSSSAGDSAMAASGSATTATTQAGLALAYAGQSSTSADGAAASAITAGTHATNAAGSAATASIQASDASGSALSASASAMVAVGAGQGYRNKNPYLASWSNISAPPDEWIWWGNPGQRQMIDLASATPFGARWNATGGTAGGLQYPTVTGQKKGVYVVSLEVTLDAVSLSGVGYLFRPLDSGGNVIDYWENQISGLPAPGGGVIGTGVAGQTYRVDTLIDCRSGAYDDMQAVSFYVIVDGYWNSTNKAVVVKMAGWRLATQAEVDQQAVLSQLGASVAAQSSAMLDLKNSHALARYEVSAITSGGAAVLRLQSTTHGTLAGIDADQIWFGPNTVFDNATDTLRTTSGGNVRVIALGASFGVDGQLTEWEGPAATTFSALSRANAYFYRANIAPYAGGSALIGTAGFQVTSRHPSVTRGATISGGFSTLTAATLDVTGAVGTVTYTWTHIFGDNDITANSPTSSSTTFYSDPPYGGEFAAVFGWTATDGATGETRSGQVFVTMIQNIPPGP